jgi:hypothetical protein
MEALFGLPGMDMARSIPGMGTLLAQPLSGDLALVQFNIAWKRNLYFEFFKFPIHLSLCLSLTDYDLFDTSQWTVLHMWLPSQRLGSFRITLKALNQQHQIF